MVKLFGPKSRNKKGSIQDIVLMAVFFLSFGLIMLISFKLVSELDTQFQANDIINQNTKDVSTTMKSQYTGVIDNSFLFFVIGTACAVLVLAAMVRIHPIFIPMFFLAWVFLIFVSGIISNIYQEVASTPQLIMEANQLTFITLTLKYLPLAIGVFGILLMVVMYKQWQVSQFA